MDELLSVQAAQAFEWVKTGHWNKVQFNKWFEAKVESEREIGYDNGYDAGFMSAEQVFGS